MISEQEKQAICDISRKYRAEKVLLFGSSADPQISGRDIDLAVQGILPKDFFSYYGELIFALSRPVDVISLPEDTRFAQMILQEGIPIYG